MNNIRTALDKEHPWSLKLEETQGWTATWQFTSDKPALAKAGKARRKLEKMGYLVKTKVVACNFGFMLEVAAGV